LVTWHTRDGPIAKRVCIGMMYHCAKFHACIIKRTSSKKNCIYLLDNFVIIEPTVLYDSGNLQKSGNRVRNQKIRSEITLEIKKSHYKSTEIRLEINRNQIRNQEIRLEITWFRNLVRFMWPCRTPRWNHIVLIPLYQH
jgi:hypothetical protein